MPAVPYLPGGGLLRSLYGQGAVDVSYPGCSGCCGTGCSVPPPDCPCIPGTFPLHWTFTMSGWPNHTFTDVWGVGCTSGCFGYNLNLLNGTFACDYSPLTRWFSASVSCGGPPNNLPAYRINCTTGTLFLEVIDPVWVCYTTGLGSCNCTPHIVWSCPWSPTSANGCLGTQTLTALSPFAGAVTCPTTANCHGFSFTLPSTLTLTPS